MPSSFRASAVTLLMAMRMPDSSAWVDLVTPSGSDPELPYAEDDERSPLLELLLCPAVLLLLESLLLPLVSADFCVSSLPNTAES